VVAEKEESLRSGLATGLELLDARRDLYSALRDLARARYVYILNSLRLKQSAGILSGEDLRQISVFMQ
jgi:outer membrane protein